MSERFVSRTLVANGLSHHVLEWDGARERTVVVLHGYLDFARSFERVCGAIAREGYRVLALDFRGHGDSAWAPPGAYYHFPDYVADLAAVLDALAPAGEAGPVRIVAHSMGGSVATLYAGALPARVRALVLAEGIGPPATQPEQGLDRTRRWLDTLPRVRGREPRRFDSMSEVIERLRGTHGGSVPDEVLASVAQHATRPHASGTGLVWRFDPLHQTTSPTRFDLDTFAAFAREIACPVLHVDAGASGMVLPDAEAREALYARRTKRVLEGAGHMMHWTQPAEFARCVVEFFREVEA